MALNEKARFFMSFSFYPLRDRDHMWNAMFGGEVRIIGGLSFMARMEFVADPYSPIFFRPRSIYFSEGVIYRFQRFAIAYVHRCKHDVDALRRTLILSGPRLYAFLDSLSLYVDLYPIRYDRTYRGDVERVKLTDTFGSVGGGFRRKLLKTFIRLDVFKDGIRPEFALSLEWRIGEDVTLGPFVRLERFYDTAINESTTPAFLGTFGIKAESRNTR